MSLLLVLLLAFAHAGQTAFETRAGPREQQFHYAWVDGEGEGHVVDFALPAAAVARDVAEPVRLPLQALANAQVAAVRAYARTVKGPTVKVRAAGGGGVALAVSGQDRGRMRAALEGAQAAAETAKSTFLDTHRWTVDDRGRIRPDHARVAAESAALVRPLAEALGMVGAEPREGLATALSFVQSIRYERHKKNTRDAGFRRPLSLLAADRGDCDGKATLFLALLRAAWPDLPAAIAYIPGHAFVGVVLEPEKGEHTFRKDKVRYVLVEPVGPALSPIGDGGGKSRRHAALGTLEVVPVP